MKAILKTVPLISMLTILPACNNTNLENFNKNAEVKSSTLQDNAGNVYYKNLQGQIQTVRAIDIATLSVYNAIEKYKNKDNEIVDPTGFYVEVEKYIPKNTVGNIRQSNEIEDINRNLKKNISAIRYQQCSDLFNKLYEMFTFPESEKGDTITEKECIKMAEAWSSTGISR